MPSSVRSDDSLILVIHENKRQHSSPPIPQKYSYAGTQAARPFVPSVLRLFRETLVDVSVVQEAPRMTATLSLVAAGLGVSIHGLPNPTKIIVDLRRRQPRMGAQASRGMAMIWTTMPTIWRS